MKIRNRIGEGMSPYMVPLPNSIGSVTAKISLILVTAFVYRSATTSMAAGGKPRPCMMHISLSWSMVLNAELKSM